MRGTLMPLYDFHCDTCTLAFEVSRSMKDSDIPAHCPMFDAQARRVFSMPMTFTRSTSSGQEAPPAAPAPAAANRWGGHGHSHGPGGMGHSH